MSKETEGAQPNPHPGIEVAEVNIDRVYELLPATRAAIALQSSKTEYDLRTLAGKHASIREIKDKAGREQAHSAAMELMRARTAVADVAKKARDDATKFSKAVIDEEKRLVAIVEPEEKRLKGLRDTWDEEQERIKRERAEAERKRILAITSQIADIKAYAALAAQCRTSLRIRELIENLTAVQIDADTFGEFTEDAAAVKSVTLTQMAATLKAKQDQEEEAARLARERAEQERVRYEQAERQRQLDEQAAEIERQRQALAAASKPADPPPPPPAPAQAPLDMSKAPPCFVPKAEATSQVVDQNPAPVANKPTRPSDEVIISAMALHFHVHESTVIQWLQDIDLAAATQRMIAAEFN